MKIIKHIKTLLLLLLTFLLGAQPTHAKTEVKLPTYQKVFVQTATTQPSTLKKVVQPNVGFLSRKLPGNVKFVVFKGISARNQHIFSEGVGGKLANGVDDLFSSFVHLKNLPTEAKTFLSAKNWDNALLTKLDGDLVSGYYPNLHNQSFSRPFAGTFL